MEGGRPCSIARPLYRVRRGVPPTNAFLPSFLHSISPHLLLTLWRAFIGGTGACLRAVVAVVAVAAWRSSIMLQVAAAMCTMPARARQATGAGRGGLPAAASFRLPPRVCVCPLPPRPFDNTPLLLPSLSPSFFPSFHCYFLLPPPIVFIFPFPR